MSASNREPVSPTLGGQPGTLLEVNEDRQVTIPAHVLEALGLEPGGRLLLDETPAGYLLSPWRMDQSGLAPLRHHLRRGNGTFDIQKFRKQPPDPSLRN